MPYLGEFKLAREIGHIAPGGGDRHVWSACEECGKERWVRYRKGQPVSLVCLQCANQIKRKNMLGLHGERARHWKGGWQKDNSGYVLITLTPDNFFYSMTNYKGQIREHRLVLAKHLKRCLLSWEIVHHRNGIKDDNRLGNLELIKGLGRHNTQVERQIIMLQKKVEVLQNRVTLLEAELVLEARESCRIEQ